MVDRITANLPSRDFEATLAFYAGLGFVQRYRDGTWMILARGDLLLEFFAHPDLDPEQSWFSACLRVDDLEALHREFSASGVQQSTVGIPRLTEIVHNPPVPRMFALVDPDGSLWRCLENGD